MCWRLYAQLGSFSLLGSVTVVLAVTVTQKLLTCSGFIQTTVTTGHRGGSAHSHPDCEILSDDASATEACAGCPSVAVPLFESRAAPATN